MTKATHKKVNVGGVTNAYDPAGNRIGIAFGTNLISYVVNPNAKLPQVLEQIKNGVTTYYIYGAGLLYQVTETATSTNVFYYHSDYRGSTVVLTGDNGNVTDRIEYSAYGSLTYRVGNTDTPFLFNGRYGVQTDPNGLLYMRARYYNPYLCRFINPDPSGFKGGLNFYAAFNGNPVSMSDPSGLGAVGDDQNLSWLTGNSATPTDLSNPFGIATDGSNGWNYEATSTSLGVAGIAQFGGEFGSGTAAIGSNFKFYSGGFYGNQYVSVTMVSDIAHYVGYPLAAFSVYTDYQNPNVSPIQFGINTGVTVIGVTGGPIGAAFGTGYTAGSLIQADVNGATAGSFQILNDWYYNAPFGPNFADLPDNP